MKTCPECEKGELQQTIKDLAFTYKGLVKRFAEMEVLVCPVCGHERLSEKASELVDRELTDFRKSVDDGMSKNACFYYGLLFGVVLWLIIPKREMAASVVSFLVA